MDIDLGLLAVLVHVLLRLGVVRLVVALIALPIIAGFRLAKCTFSLLRLVWRSVSHFIYLHQESTDKFGFCFFMVVMFFAYAFMLWQMIPFILSDPVCLMSFVLVLAAVGGLGLVVISTALGQDWRE